jgi:hypothetical protein
LYDDSSSRREGRADEGLTVAADVNLYPVGAKGQELLRRAIVWSMLPETLRHGFRERPRHSFRFASRVTDPAAGSMRVRWSYCSSVRRREAAMNWTS